MSTRITIKFNPAGFAECLNSLSGEVKSVAERLAEQAKVESGGRGTYTVKIHNEPRYKDSQYGVSRPIAIARVYADEAGSIDEAENKSMSKAVSG